MTSKCIAIRIAAATDYGHSDWETGTVAYQCEKNATQGKFCGICAKHKGAFGKIGCSYSWEDGTESTVPEYALKDGTMEDGTKVDKGDAMCCVFANPLMDTDANCEMMEKKQELLGDEYWQCDKEEDEYDYEDDEGDWTDDEECDDEQDCDDEEQDSSPRKKALTIAELREMCDENDIDHDGLSKPDMRQALDDTDAPAPKKAKGKAKKPSPKDKVKRKPSAYNLYMKSALKKYKSKNPNTEHQVAFKACAAQWTKGKDKKSKSKSKTAAA